MMRSSLAGTEGHRSIAEDLGGVTSFPYSGGSMGWRPIEPRIETLRDDLATDPAGVRLRVLEILENNPKAGGRPAVRLRPSDRLRLLGLVVAADRKLGELGAGETAATAGLKIRTTSPVAQADFLLQLGAFRMDQGRGGEALQLINRAGQLMARELGKPLPAAKESRRRRRWIQATKAASHVLRGQVCWHLSVGSIDEAFSDALEALQLTSGLVKSSSHMRRVHLAAVVLLCALLVRFGPPEMVRRAFKCLDHAERTLIYRCRVPADHVHRIKLKWCRALAFARLGSFGKSERMLVDVIEQLIAGGFHEDARKALDALVWVLEQTRFPLRAGYMVKKYGPQCL